MVKSGCFGRVWMGCAASYKLKPPSRQEGEVAFPSRDEVRLYFHLYLN